MLLILVIRSPKLRDLVQKIPTFPNCDNYGIHRSSNPNPTTDDVKLNDNALLQQICTHFKSDYLEEMDFIIELNIQNLNFQYLSMYQKFKFWIFNSPYFGPNGFRYVPGSYCR